jgi:hypothetical protein
MGKHYEQDSTFFDTHAFAGSNPGASSVEDHGER